MAKRERVAYEAMSEVLGLEVSYIEGVKGEG